VMHIPRRWLRRLRSFSISHRSADVHLLSQTNVWLRPADSTGGCNMNPPPQLWPFSATDARWSESRANGLPLSSDEVHKWIDFSHLGAVNYHSITKTSKLWSIDGIRMKVINRR
jgi:hypothetical protein